MRRPWVRLAATLSASVVLAVAVPSWAGPASAAPGDAVARPDDAPVATSPVDTLNPCDRTVLPPPGADGTTCMLPFPSNLYTTGTGTDRRLNLPVAGMPKDAAGKPISPLPYDVSDGFSPGQLIVVHVPGLDNPAAFAKTGSVPITDMARYADLDAPVVVFDVQTGKRHPIFTEIDVNPLNPLPQSTAGDVTSGPARPQNTANVNFLVRPAKNFEYGHRYVVAMRDLKDAAGATIPASTVFASYRDKGPLTAQDPRTERYEKDVFPVIESAGIARSSLYQAWDFSVASAPSVTSRLLAMRDDAFRQLGDTDLADRVVTGTAPTFTASTPTVDTEGVRTVQGTFTVPCYISTPSCAPGGQFVFDPQDTAQRTPLQLPGNTTTAAFTCKVPKRVYDAPGLEKLRPSLYGHGLLGGQGEVGQGQVKAMTAEHGFLYCATDWEGFATRDIVTVGQALADMDRFPAVIDHTLQGELNFLYLARLMIHPEGFGADPAFQVTKDGKASSFIDTTRAYYDGNSQGGIYGGTVMAVAPDVDRGVLGVPGINYSTLLQRSTDFATYAIPLYTAYPSEYERQLLLSVVQILWDRADPSGYQNTLAPGRELPGTPPHVVMYQAGFGDHQVANLTADTAARSIGAAVDPTPFEDPARSPDVEDVWGVPRIPAYPYRGSALVYFDIGPLDYAPGKGTAAPPTADVAQRGGQDPHEAPRNTPCGRVMKSNFLRPDGVVTNPCGGAPYFAFDYKGKDGQPGQGDAVRPGDALPYTTPVAPTAPSSTSPSPTAPSPTLPRCPEPQRTRPPVVVPLADDVRRADRSGSDGQPEPVPHQPRARRARRDHRPRAGHDPAGRGVDGQRDRDPRQQPGGPGLHPPRHDLRRGAPDDRPVQRQVLLRPHARPQHPGHGRGHGRGRDRAQRDPHDQRPDERQLGGQPCGPADLPLHGPRAAPSGRAADHDQPADGRHGRDAGPDAHPGRRLVPGGALLPLGHDAAVPGDRDRRHPERRRLDERADAQGLLTDRDTRPRPGRSAGSADRPGQRAGVSGAGAGRAGGRRRAPWSPGG